MRQSIKFNKKKHIWNGMVSCILAAVECLLFLLLSWISFRQNGNSGNWIGMVCVIIILMALWGIDIGAKGVRKTKRVYKRSSWIGIVLNVAVIVGMVFLFFCGL